MRDGRLDARGLGRSDVFDRQLDTAAVPAPAAAAPAQSAPAAPILTVRQVYDTLTAAGYRNITEIELEHQRAYDVKAENAQGQRVKLRVDAQTGAVLRSRIKD
ncbi:MAG: PepSY domain-containing protein [Achromobacter sp.]|nr:PepSY domain-containing protein [Achromobacter sp.]